MPNDGVDIVKLGVATKFPPGVVQNTVEKLECSHVASPAVAGAPCPPCPVVATEVPSPQACSTRWPVTGIGGKAVVCTTFSEKLAARIFAPAGTLAATLNLTSARRFCGEPSCPAVMPMKMLGPLPLLRAPVALSYSVLSAAHGTVTVVCAASGAASRARTRCGRRWRCTDAITEQMERSNGGHCRIPHDVGGARPPAIACSYFLPPLSAGSFLALPKICHSPFPISASFFSRPSFASPRPTQWMRIRRNAFMRRTSSMSHSSCEYGPGYHRRGVRLAGVVLSWSVTTLPSP